MVRSFGDEARDMLVGLDTPTITRLPQGLATRSHTLKRHGYVRFEGTDLLPDDVNQRLWRKLLEASRRLPPDPYCKEQNRFRRLGWAYFQPWDGGMRPRPALYDPLIGKFAPFEQTQNLNSVDGGIKRKLPAFEDALLNDPDLHALIRANYRLLAGWWSERHVAIEVGVHLIMQVGLPGLSAVASPDELHRDGQPFTFCHYVDRRNALGGENLIAPAFYAKKKPGDVPPEDVLERFTLTRPMQGYAVKDVQVSHYVSPVSVVPGRELGIRTVLLVDFAATYARLV